MEQTRWGVGFGPRDCSDYQTGISVIPIGRLTDADRKWLLSAEFGGTGGKPIEGQMVVEEPDIEIGAGVSSKGTCLFLLRLSIPSHPTLSEANVRLLHSHKPAHGHRSRRQDRSALHTSTTRQRRRTLPTQRLPGWP